MQQAGKPYPVFEVTKKALDSIRAGHPWIYDTEIVRADPHENGGFCTAAHRGKPIGTAVVSDRSKIRLRLISTNPEEVPDAEFFRRRLREACELRRMVMKEEFSCCRLIYGESDFLPGLTVDRFEDVLVTQTLSLGLERLKPMLFPMLAEILREDYGAPVRAVFERNDVPIREKEGLEQNTGFFPLEGAETGSTETVITENGLKFEIDFEHGQKTGYFLDQKFNRRAVMELSGGKRVLDCFCHTGPFALCAAKGGAESVLAVDVSKEALLRAAKNAALNGLPDAVEWKDANVFDLLPAFEKGMFDFIILDPPAFAKSRKALDRAVKGYKEINLRAMKQLPRGGILATCSCSHFMTEPLFREMLQSAAHDAGVLLREIAVLRQSPDHPILWNVPETDYLKFFILQVL